MTQPHREMSKIRTWFKQKLCTHYYETTSTGLPLYCMYPKKFIWPHGDFPRYAKDDLEAHTCLNCGVKFFDTTSPQSDSLLTSELDNRNKFGRFL